MTSPQPTTPHPGDPQDIVSQLTFRPYEPGDEHAILASFNRVFRDLCGPAFVERDLATWRWLYQENPVGLRIQLALARDGTVAGQWAGVPLRARTPAGALRFVHVADNLVHPDYRKGRYDGPGVFAVVGESGTQEWFARGDAMLYGYPVPLGERMGRRFLQNRRLRVVDYLCRDVDTVQAPAAAGVRVERALELGPETDALFEALASRESFLLERDAAYLRWRYLACPQQPYRVLEAWRAARLVGLAVLRLESDLCPGACAIADWIVPSAEASIARALWVEAAVHARAAGRSVLLASFAESSPEFALFRREGFRLVSSAETFERALTYRVHPAHAEITEELLRASWWYTLGDSDLV